ncbi:MAG: Major Facilitator Superfamily protein [Methanosaeta sp. PtaU1.Bin028]|nr:MAG: Major Facilitator Superfamily protein [Methanosaeta sp. PtaU1.Bin028]
MAKKKRQKTPAVDWGNGIFKRSMRLDPPIESMLVASNSYANKVRRFSSNARLYLAFHLLTTVNAGIYGVIFNLYILSLGFREDFLGLILSISSLSVGLFAMPSAFVCDRLGRKRTLLLSSVLLAVSLLFLYNTTSQVLLVAFSIAFGMASSLSLITGSIFLLENSSAEERMYLFSMSSLIYTLSALSGNMIGGFLPGILSDMFTLDADSIAAYRITLYVSLTAIIISMLPLAYMRDERRMEIAISSGQLLAYKSVFGSKNARRMVLFFCLFGIGWGMSLPYFNVYLDSVLGASASQIGMIFSASQVFMVVGYFLVPIFAERVGKIRLASSVQILSIPFLLMFTFASNLLVAATGFVMRYMLMNMANPVLNSFKLEIVRPNERSMINSITWMACHTFVGVGTYAGGMMMANGWNSMPFLVTGVFYAVSAAYYYICFNKLEETA